MHDERCFRCHDPAVELRTVETEGARVLVPLCPACRLGAAALSVALHLTFTDGTISAHGPSAPEPATPVRPHPRLPPEQLFN